MPILIELMLIATIVFLGVWAIRKILSNNTTNKNTKDAKKEALLQEKEELRNIKDEVVITEELVEIVDQKKNLKRKLTDAETKITTNHGEN